MKTNSGIIDFLSSFFPISTLYENVHCNFYRRYLEMFILLIVIDKDLFKSELVFIPWNLSNTHWCLLIIDNKIERYIFVDPLLQVSIIGDQKIDNYMKELKSKKFLKGKYGALQVQHSKQPTSWSCGHSILIVFFNAYIQNVLFFIFVNFVCYIFILFQFSKFYIPVSIPI